MGKKKYAKVPLSYEEQLNLIKSRGLIVDDDHKATSYFQQISYYRLSVFFLPYQKDKDQFNPGTTFDNILDTYTFDRELRLLVFDCIERIEIAIRTQLISVLSMKYKNAHWQDDQRIFKPAFQVKNKFTIDPFNDLQKIVSKARSAKHPEVFIKHYMDTYSSPANPPAWMCLELLTIGELSRVYDGLKNNSDKQGVADFFKLPHKVFTSWLHALTYMRNICAHHSRLWNRNFAIKPDILKKPRLPWLDAQFNNNSRTFYALCVIQYLMKNANPSNHFKNKLVALFKKYQGVPIRYLGIPSDKTGKMLDWQNEPLWN
ncbi:Abortive infection bacteriophage resistance protein [Reichenbachiella agariperforans]|uniref:Abortive infection bacteriophage resistance protein n=1 Tax=Reichenbachiella agariperforans TaxID=156994 RepID=A0A1M6KSG3_REIAG|nr:Abi family protein [Reichenbachiella agariperforans]SHJ61935.1 Abortive infection bacteriophage resistance protein [Reichenbachiella agariperforans]